MMHAYMPIASVLSNSLGRYGPQHVRLLCPWDFPGKNTGVGYHFLLQGIFPTQGSKILECGLLCLLQQQGSSLSLAPPGKPVIYKSMLAVWGVPSGLLQFFLSPPSRRVALCGSMQTSQQKHSQAFCLITALSFRELLPLSGSPLKYEGSVHSFLFRDSFEQGHVCFLNGQGQDQKTGWFPSSKRAKFSLCHFIILFEVNSQKIRHTHIQC